MEGQWQPSTALDHVRRLVRVLEIGNQHPVFERIIGVVVGQTFEDLYEGLPLDKHGGIISVKLFALRSTPVHDGIEVDSDQT